MINLAPFLKKIAELQEEVTKLQTNKKSGQNEASSNRKKEQPKGQPKKSENLPPADILAQFEQRANEAEQRIKALTARTTQLEQQLNAARQDQKQPQAVKAQPGSGDKKEAASGKKKEKKKEGKGGSVSPFIAFQQTLNKGPSTFVLPLVHLSQINEQYVCSFCQDTHKTFFPCANDGCFHRPCVNCAHPCDKCGASICRFCGDCWKCSSPQEASLPEKAKTLREFCHFNAVHLGKITGWPGLTWIDKALSRLTSWQDSHQTNEPLGVLLSFQWNSRGEIRALEFLLPILRALLLHTPITKSSNDRAQPKRDLAPALDSDNKGDS